MNVRWEYKQNIVDTMTILTITSILTWTCINLENVSLADTHQNKEDLCRSSWRAVARYLCRRSPPVSSCRTKRIAGFCTWYRLSRRTRCTVCNSTMLLTCTYTVALPFSYFQLHLPRSIRRPSKHLCRHHCNILVSAAASRLRRTYSDPIAWRSPNRSSCRAPSDN